MSEPTLLKTGSGLMIVGAVLGIVVNVLHPRTSDVTNVSAYAELFSSSGIWVGDHLGILVAILFISAGLLALYRSFSGERAIAFARLGAGSLLVSASVWSVLVGIDGIAVKRLADAWAAAPPPEKAAALSAFQIATTVNLGIFFVGVILLFGTTFILYGLAVAWSDEYPRWLGWAGVVLGIANALVGFVLAYQGESQLVSNQIFPVVSILQSAWILWIGVLLWRRTAAARQPARAMA